LSGIFWGEQSEDSARGCLNTALWRLRRVLEPPGVRRGTYLVSTPDGEIGFDSRSRHWLDVAVLEEGAKRALARPSGAPVGEAEIDQLEAALDVYTGDLLQGTYSDWALRERERLRELYLACLGRLMQYQKRQGRYDKALSCGQRILALDAIREDVHREMMELYAETGQRALAIKQYNACRDILASELDVEPMGETRSLFARLRDAVPDAVETAPEDSGLRSLLEWLRHAVEGLEQSRMDCQRVIKLVERLAEGRSYRR
jgi:DNA-binding SARP family transcriptional activator